MLMEGKMNLGTEKNFIKKVVLVSVAVLLVSFIIYNFTFITNKFTYMFGVLTPFFIALFISYLLSRPVSYLEEKFKINRIIALVIVYTLFVGLSVLAVAYIVPLVFDASIKLGTDLANNAAKLPQMFVDVDLGPIENVIKQNLNKVTEILSELSNILISNVSSLILSLTSTLLNFLLGIVISLYMLLDKEKIINSFKRLSEALFSDNSSDALESFFQSVNSVFSHFLRGLIVEAMIISTISAIALKIIGVRYSVFLGIVILILYLIPTVGLVLAMVPVVISVLTYDPGKAIWALVVMLIIQQIDGNIIAPRIMGDSVGLDPFWIILSIMVFGALMGIAGVIFAIPFAAIVKTTIVKYVERKEREEKAGLKEKIKNQ